MVPNNMHYFPYLTSGLSLSVGDKDITAGINLMRIALNLYTRFRIVAILILQSGAGEMAQ